MRAARQGGLSKEGAYESTSTTLASEDEIFDLGSESGSADPLSRQCSEALRDVVRVSDDAVLKAASAQPELRELLRVWRDHADASLLAEVALRVRGLELLVEALVA